MAIFMLTLPILFYTFVILFKEVKFNFYIFRTNLLYSFIAFIFLFVIKFFIDVEFLNSQSLLYKFFFYFVNYDFFPIFFIVLFYIGVYKLKSKVEYNSEIFNFLGKFTYIVSIFFMMTIYELCYYQLGLTSYELFIYPFIRVFYSLGFVIAFKYLADFSNWKTSLIRYLILAAVGIVISCLGMIASVGNIFFSIIAVLMIYVAAFFSYRKCSNNFKCQIFN